MAERPFCPPRVGSRAFAVTLATLSVVVLISCTPSAPMMRQVVDATADAQPDAQMDAEVDAASPRQEEDAGDAAPPVPVTLTPSGAIEAETEILQEGVSGATVSALRVLTQLDGAWSLWDPALGAQREFATDAPFSSLGVSPANEVLVFGSDGVFIWEGDAVAASPLGDLLPGPISGAQTDAAGIWLAGEDGLHRYKDGFLQGVSLEENPITGPFRAGARWNGAPAIWVAAEALYAIVEDGFAHSAVTAAPFAEISHLSVDAEDRVWIRQQDGAAFRRDGGWQALLFDSPLVQLMGNPAADQTWFQFESGAWVHSDGEFWTVDVPPGQWIGVDEAGRLLVLGDQRLTRTEIERSVGIIHFPRLPLKSATELIFDPSHYAETAEVRVAINGTEQVLEGPPWTLALVPSDLGQGLVNLSVEVRYGDTTQAETHREFFVDLGQVSWEADIAPLSEAKCGACHGGNTATLLATKAQWIDEIEAIITMVELEAMPQGGPPLMIDEIGKIIQWRDAGFP